jgi:hypothetical protein
VARALTTSHTRGALPGVPPVGDLITALGEAEPDHKLEVYRSLGLA